MGFDIRQTDYQTDICNSRVAFTSEKVIARERAADLIAEDNKE